MKIITNKGMHMPALGLGTWPMRDEVCRDAVASGIGLGYRHIDTARSYENEAAVGAGIAAAGIARDALHVTTKVWWNALTPSLLRASLDASLDALKLDYVDLYLIHWPAPDMDLEAVLDTMMEAQQAGKVRAIGVSNFTLALFERAVAHGAPIACNQVEYHVLLSQDRLLAACRRHGAVLTAYAPLARGRLAELTTLQEIARKHGASPEQIALAWLLDQDSVVAIPKAARPASQRANLAAVDIHLDDADRAAIAALPKDQRFVSPAFAPAWDTP